MLDCLSKKLALHIQIFELFLFLDLAVMSSTGQTVIAVILFFETNLFPGRLFNFTRLGRCNMCIFDRVGYSRLHQLGFTLTVSLKKLLMGISIFLLDSLWYSQLFPVFKKYQLKKFEANEAIDEQF